MTTHELAALLYKEPNIEVLMGQPNGIKTLEIKGIYKVNVKEIDLRDNPRPFCVIVPEGKRL